jgi:hypothetical protein
MLGSLQADDEDRGNSISRHAKLYLAHECLVVEIVFPGHHVSHREVRAPVLQFVLACERRIIHVRIYGFIDDLMDLNCSCAILLSSPPSMKICGSPAQSGLGTRNIWITATPRTAYRPKPFSRPERTGRSDIRRRVPNSYALG